MGGEEFIIILPNTDEGGAKAFFERIRKIIERHDFGCKITVSAGITFIQEYTETEVLIEKADSALYQAKRKKNMIAVYER